MAGDPWGGSEELWSRTARRLAMRGLRVVASVQGWPQLDARILDLTVAGVDVRPRYASQSFSARLRRRLSGKSQLLLDVETVIGGIRPDLVLISEGSSLPPIDLVELCISKDWPFAAVVHANCDAWWPRDELAARYRKAIPMAKRWFFVSEANRLLEEKQLGCELKNAEVIRNPITIDFETPVRWPIQSATHMLSMACVGRLDPIQKGQDLLLEALAKHRWSERNWKLTLYGSGRYRDSLERLVHRLNLIDRVVFAGHVSADQIWLKNHLLVMPSRYEGLPLTIVEAMLCGRPVLATKVAGNPEVVKHGETGFLANNPSVESLEEALELAWEMRGNLHEMGIAALARVRVFASGDPIGVFAEKLLSLAGGRLEHQKANLRLA